MRSEARQLGKVEKEEEWDTKDVADFLGVSEDFVYRGAAAKEIPGYKLAARWRFAPADIRAWKETQKQRWASKEE